MTSPDFHSEGLRHSRRLDKYVFEIKQLFRQANYELVSLSNRVSIIGVFQFDNYPVIRQQAHAITESLINNIVAIITEADLNEWNEANALMDEVLESLDVDSLSKHAPYLTHNMEQFNEFVSRFISGKTLYNKVTEYVNEYVVTIELAITQGNINKSPLKTIVNQLDYALTRPLPLAARVQQLVADTDNLFIALSATYLAQQSGIVNPGAGRYRSSFRNVARLARNEIAQAYRESLLTRFRQMDFIVAFDIMRGSNYPCKACEALKGRYPRSFTWNKWHVFCLCMCVPVYKTKDEIEEDNRRIILGLDPLPIESSVNYISRPPSNFYSHINENYGPLSRDYNNPPYFIRDNSQFIEQTNNVFIGRAQKFAGEFDNVSRNIAIKTGAIATPVNIKSPARVAEKARLDYNGDMSKVQDVVRNTFIIEDNQRGFLLSEIHKEFTVLRFKEQLAADNPMGYSGIIMNVVNDKGIIAEIQINSAQIIYGKHLNAEQLLGVDLYNQIRSLSGTESGRGHILYEQWRVMDPLTQSGEARRITEESRNYYEYLRKIKL